MKTWVVVNQKGGVGKTTTAVSLAGLLAKQGQRTLLIDLDPHASLTSYFRYDAEAVERSVYSLFENQQEPHVALTTAIQQTRFDHLDLLPASTALATLDRQLSGREGMGLVIQNALQGCSNRYDYTVIDCPPMLGVLMINALAAADHLIIPVQTEFLALKGLERMLLTLNMVQRSLHKTLPHTIVPTIFDRRTRASQQSLDFLQTKYPNKLWDDVIPVDTQFREASQAGAPIAFFRGHSKGAQAYSRLLMRLLQPVVVAMKVASQ